MKIEVFFSHSFTSADSAIYKVKSINDKFHKIDESTKTTANKMVAKWFNMQADGTMNFDLIGERGQYDATALDVKKADQMSKSVNTQLKDAGVENGDHVALCMTGSFPALNISTIACPPEIFWLLFFKFIKKLF